jgi:FAD synthetase
VKKINSIIEYSEIEKNKKIFENKKTVLVGGCFDIFHYGHTSFLKEAAKKGDFLIVALESDEFIKRSKKRSSFHNQRQRAEILVSFRMVDMVILLPSIVSNEDYLNLVKKIRPTIIAVTKNDPMIKNKQLQIDQVGGKLEIVIENLNKFSSKKIYEVFFSS